MWHAKPRDNYLLYDGMPDSDGTDNILEIRDILRTYSYTDEAITGVIMNCIHEGGLNPWRWQADTYDTSLGCGLYGFTPASRYLDTDVYPYSIHMNLSTTVITPNALPDVGAQQTRIMADGDWGWHSSCWREYDPIHDRGWNPALYPELYQKHFEILNTYGDGEDLTQQQYALINNMYDATFAFLCCFEGPKVPNYDARIENITRIYEIITGHPPTPPTPPTRRKGMPVYMMIKRLI